MTKCADGEVETWQQSPVSFSFQQCCLVSHRSARTDAHLIMIALRRAVMARCVPGRLCQRSTAIATTNYSQYLGLCVLCISCRPNIESMTLDVLAAGEQALLYYIRYADRRRQDADTDSDSIAHTRRMQWTNAMQCNGRTYRPVGYVRSAVTVWMSKRLIRNIAGIFFTSLCRT